MEWHTPLQAVSSGEVSKALLPRGVFMRTGFDLSYGQGQRGFERSTRTVVGAEEVPAEEARGRGSTFCTWASENREATYHNFLLGVRLTEEAGGARAVGGRGWHRPCNFNEVAKSYPCNRFLIDYDTKFEHAKGPAEETAEAAAARVLLDDHDIRDADYGEFIGEHIMRVRRVMRALLHPSLCNNESVVAIVLMDDRCRRYRAGEEMNNRHVRFEFGGKWGAHVIFPGVVIADGFAPVLLNFLKGQEAEELIDESPLLRRAIRCPFGSKERDAETGELKGTRYAPACILRQRRGEEQATVDFIDGTPEGLWRALRLEELDEWGVPHPAFLQTLSILPSREQVARREKWLMWDDARVANEMGAMKGALVVHSEGTLPEIIDPPGGPAEDLDDLLRGFFPRRPCGADDVAEMYAGGVLFTNGRGRAMQAEVTVDNPAYERFIHNRVVWFNFAGGVDLLQRVDDVSDLFDRSTQLTRATRPSARTAAMNAELAPGEFTRPLLSLRDCVVPINYARMRRLPYEFLVTRSCGVVRNVKRPTVGAVCLPPALRLLPWPEEAFSADDIHHRIMFAEYSVKDPKIGAAVRWDYASIVGEAIAEAHLAQPPEVSFSYVSASEENSRYVRNIVSEEDFAAPAPLRVLHLEAPCGTGKTEAAVRAVKVALDAGHNVCWVAPRIELCVQAVSRLTARESGIAPEAVFLYNVSRRVSDVVQRLCERAGGSVFVTTLSSLYHLSHDGELVAPFRFILMDEVNTLFRDVLGQHLDRNRALVLGALRMLVSRSRVWLSMDADFSELNYALIPALVIDWEHVAQQGVRRVEFIHYHRGDLVPPSKRQERIAIFLPKEEEFIWALCREILYRELADANGRRYKPPVALFCPSQTALAATCRAVDRLVTLAQGRRLHYRIITGPNKRFLRGNDGRRRELRRAVEESMEAPEVEQLQLFAYNCAMDVGMDVNIPDLFYSVFCLAAYEVGINAPVDQHRQACERVRHFRLLYVHVGRDVRAKNLPLKTLLAGERRVCIDTEIAETRADFDRVHELARFNRETAGWREVRMRDGQAASTWFAMGRCEREACGANFQRLFMARLLEEGYSVWSTVWKRGPTLPAGFATQYRAVRGEVAADSALEISFFSMSQQDDPLRRSRSYGFMADVEDGIPNGVEGVDFDVRQRLVNYSPFVTLVRQPSTRDACLAIHVADAFLTHADSEAVATAFADRFAASISGGTLVTMRDRDVPQLLCQAHLLTVLVPFFNLELTGNDVAPPMEHVRGVLLQHEAWLREVCKHESRRRNEDGSYRMEDDQAWEHGVEGNDEVWTNFCAMKSLAWALSGKEDVVEMVVRRNNEGLEPHIDVDAEEWARLRGVYEYYCVADHARPDGGACLCGRVFERARAVNPWPGLLRDASEETVTRQATLEEYQAVNRVPLAGDSASMARKKRRVA